MNYLTDLRSKIWTRQSMHSDDFKWRRKIVGMINNDIKTLKTLPRPPAGRIRRRRSLDENEAQPKDRYERWYKQVKLSYNDEWVEEHWRFLVAQRNKYSELILREGNDELINNLLSLDLIIELPTTLEAYERLKDKIGLLNLILDYSVHLPTSEYIAQELDNYTWLSQKAFEHILEHTNSSTAEYLSIRNVYIRFMLAFPETFSLDSYDLLIKLLLEGPEVQDKAIFDLLLSVEEFPDLLATQKHLNSDRLFEILDYAVQQGLSSNDELFELLLVDNKRMSYLRGEVFLREEKPFRDVLLAFISARDFRDAVRIRKNLVAEQLGLRMSYEFDCELNPDAETVLCLVEMLIHQNKT